MNYLRFARTHPDAVAFGILLTLCSSFGQTFFIGLFNQDIRDAFGIGHGTFGTVYMIGTIGSAVALVWTGKLIDRMRLSTYAAAVCLAMAGACLLLAVGEGVVMLTLAIFALRQAGQGLMSHTAVAAMARRFDRNRGKAISLAAFGHPLGEGVLPLPAVMLAAAIGWREAWLAAAALVLLVVTPLAWRLVSRWDHGTATGEVPPRDPAQDPSQDPSQDPAQAPAPAPMIEGEPTADLRDTDPAKRAPRRSWTRAEVLRDPRFHLLLPGVLAPSFVITGFLFHLQPIAAAKGWDPQLAAGALTAYAIAATVAAVIGGQLVDSHGARRVLPLFLPLMAAASLILALPPSSAGGAMAALVAIAFMAFQGAAAGMTFAAVSAGWAELYGTGHIGEVRAVVVSLTVFSSALAPAAMGWLFDAGIGVSTVALGCGLYCVVAMLLVRRALQPHLQPA